MAVVLISARPWATHDFLDGLPAHALPMVPFPAYVANELEGILTRVSSSSTANT